MSNKENGISNHSGVQKAFHALSEASTINCRLTIWQLLKSKTGLLSYEEQAIQSLVIADLFELAKLYCLTCENGQYGIDTLAQSLGVDTNAFDNGKLASNIDAIAELYEENLWNDFANWRSRSAYDQFGDRK